VSDADHTQEAEDWLQSAENAVSDYVEGDVLDPDDPLLPTVKLRAAYRWAMQQCRRPYERWVPGRDDAPAQARMLEESEGK